GRRPAVAAHGRGRPRLDHAGGERHLVGRRTAPFQPARPRATDPHRRADPRSTGHPLPPPAGALDARRRPVGRPGTVTRLLHPRSMSRAFLDKQPHEVAAMFDGVSSGYDRTNPLLSFGLDRSWRSSTRAALALRVGERCLDLAAGTLVSTEELSLSGAYVVG